MNKTREALHGVTGEKGRKDEHPPQPPQTVTWSLVLSVMASVLRSLQIGYHTGNINAPQMVNVQEKEIWHGRFQEPMSLHALTMLWSFTVSTLALGATVSALTVGIVADHYGRYMHNSILTANSLSLMAVGFMGVSKIAGSLEALIVGRFLIGLFCGLNMTLIPLYIQEISPTRRRLLPPPTGHEIMFSGKFLSISWFQIMSLENVLGTSRWWPLMLSLSAIPAVLQYLTLPFCPESPRYFIINCHEDELAAKLQRLRGTQDVLEEIEEMKEEAANLKGTEDVTMLRLFIVPSYKQPILIALILNASSQLSGFNVVGDHRGTRTSRLFRSKGQSNTMNGNLHGGAGHWCISVLPISLHLRTQGEVPWTKYFLILALFTMVAFYEIGPGPISWYITAELFSQSARPVAMGLTSSWNWFHKFIVAMFYQPLLHLVGPYVFLLFTGFLLVAVLYTFFRVPETRSRTFKEVAAEFRQYVVGEYHISPTSLAWFGPATDI
uniref:Major facilitator superfamily (MFS) profile domain-containing protein n=1 Tax=Chrysemys picta bellii TaxID=8478 RepID=A0A8C3HAK4_CHRPI